MPPPPPPPPVTPSPFRFVINSKKKQHPRPPPSSSSSQQFAPTPRFHVSAAPPPPLPPPPSTSSVNHLQTLRPIFNIAPSSVAEPQRRRRPVFLTSPVRVEERIEEPEADSSPLQKKRRILFDGEDIDEGDGDDDDDGGWSSELDGRGLDRLGQQRRIGEVLDVEDRYGGCETGLEPPGNYDGEREQMGEQEEEGQEAAELAESSLNSAPIIPPQTPNPPSSTIPPDTTRRPRFRFSNPPSTPSASASTKSLSTHLRSIRSLNDTPQPRELASDYSPSKPQTQQKYIPNGLAATVAGWILELRGGGIVAREQIIGRISVDMVKKDENYILVKGAEVGGIGNGVSRNALLIGDPKNIGITTVEEIGGGGIRIGYGVPWWDIQLLGEEWRVLVFWKIEEMA